MEINPSLARLRILESIETVQLQREAAPDAERAGCPGCPYFWSCPVPHRAETVVAPAEVERTDVAALNASRPAFQPRGVEDIGWTDDWVDDEHNDQVAPPAHADEQDSRLFTDEGVAVVRPGAARRCRGEGRGLPMMGVLTQPVRKTSTCLTLPSRALT